MFVAPAAPPLSALPIADEPPATPDPFAPYAIALLGHGDPGHDGGLLTDSIMIVLVQPRAQRIHLVSLPRDIWVELPLIETEQGTQTKGYKINAAYAIGKDLRQYPQRPEAFSGDGGGGALAQYAIEQVTGISVKYFLAVNFSAFEQTVDQLGGLSVRVPRGFIDEFYPISEEIENDCGLSEEDIAAITATTSGEQLMQAFPCRYERLVFDAGTQLLDGATALKYVRSRHSPQSGGDFNRAARQQAVVEALKERVLSLGFVPKIPGLLLTLSRNIETNIPPQQIDEWASMADELAAYPIDRTVLSTENVLKHGRSSDRQFILVPQDASNEEFPWLGVHEWLQAEIESQIES